MVFTVLSGSSERFEPQSIAGTGRIAFVDIFTMNKLFIQGVKSSTADAGIKKLLNDYKSLRNYLDSDIPDARQNYEQLSTIELATADLYTNDAIAHNSLWKSAVF